jgi:hypothetical protein
VECAVRAAMATPIVAATFEVPSRDRASQPPAAIVPTETLASGPDRRSRPRARATLRDATAGPSGNLSCISVPPMTRHESKAERIDDLGAAVWTGAGPDVDEAHSPRDESSPTNRDPAQLRLQRDGNRRPLFPDPYEGMVLR